MKKKGQSSRHDGRVMSVNRIRTLACTSAAKVTVLDASDSVPSCGLRAAVARAGRELGALYAMLYVHLSNQGARAFYEARGCCVSAISPPANDAAGGVLWYDFEIREVAL